MRVGDLRATPKRVFGISDGGFGDLFGMTEPTNQVFDGSNVAVGPLGERPKTRHVWGGPSLRDPHPRGRGRAVRVVDPELGGQSFADSVPATYWERDDEDYVSLHGVAEVARRIAVDRSAVDQQACLSPQVYLVTGAQARAVARAMSLAADDYPPGTIDAEGATVSQHRRRVAEWRAASTTSGEVWSADGLEWTVALDDTLLPLSGAGNRVARIVAVPRPADVVEAVRPYARHLQNVALGAVGDEFWRTAEYLARLGVSRVTAPGERTGVSMAWRHDGLPRRWCAVEQHPEAAI